MKLSNVTIKIESAADDLEYIAQKRKDKAAIEYSQILDALARRINEEVKTSK